LRAIAEVMGAGFEREGLAQEIAGLSLYAAEDLAALTDQE